MQGFFCFKSVQNIYQVYMSILIINIIYEQYKYLLSWYKLYNFVYLITLAPLSKSY